MKREIYKHTIRLAKFCDGPPILAGSIRGKQVFSTLVIETRAPSEPTICYLDFEDVQLATASFLRESVYAYRTHVRAQWPFLYPVIANANESIVEELALCLASRSDAMVAVRMKSGVATEASLVGVIDGKQRDTLRLVVDRKCVEAPRLADELGDLATTWNNRLAALTTKGLVIEESLGRGKRYLPVVEDLRYGS